MKELNTPLSQNYLSKVGIRNTNFYFTKSWDHILNPPNPSFLILVAHFANASFLIFRKHSDIKAIAIKWNSVFNPLSTNITKWSNTLKQFVGKLPTDCLSVFDHFVGLALKELTAFILDSIIELIFTTDFFVFWIH